MCSADAVGPPTTTMLAHGFMNGAVARLADGTLAFVGNKYYPRRAPDREYGCLAMHSMLAGQVPDKVCRSTAVVAPPVILGELPASLPKRHCVNVLNFRANGPEDARLLAHGQNGNTVLVFGTDYVSYPPPEAATPPVVSLSVHEAAEANRTGGYGRQPHLQAVTFVRAGSDGTSRRIEMAGPPLRLRAASAAASAALGLRLGRIEKNWVPFISAAGGVHVLQWVSDSFGTSVALRIEPRDGIIVERFVSTHGDGALRAAMGGLDARVAVCGGTAAVALNDTTLFAIGHTRHPSQSAYGMFAYTFSAHPPFGLLAASPEFQISLPSAAEEQQLSGGADATSAAATRSWSATALKWGKPWHNVGGGAGTPHPVEFPMGLAMMPSDAAPAPGHLHLHNKNMNKAHEPASAEAADPRLLLTWGRGNRDTAVTWLRLGDVLGHLTPLQRSSGPLGATRA